MWQVYSHNSAFHLHCHCYKRSLLLNRTGEQDKQVCGWPIAGYFYPPPYFPHKRSKRTLGPESCDATRLRCLPSRLLSSQRRINFRWLGDAYLSQTSFSTHSGISITSRRASSQRKWIIELLSDSGLDRVKPITWLACQAYISTRLLFQSAEPHTWQIHGLSLGLSVRMVIIPTNVQASVVTF